MHGGMQHVWQKCITLWTIMQSQCTRVPFLKENQTPTKGLYVVWRLFKNNNALSQVDPSPFQRIIMWNHGILGCCILLKGSYFNGLNPSHIYCKGSLFRDCCQGYIDCEEGLSGKNRCRRADILHVIGNAKYWSQESVLSVFPTLVTLTSLKKCWNRLK